MPTFLRASIANVINRSRPDISGLETYCYSEGYCLARSIHRNILSRINIRDRGWYYSILALDFSPVGNRIR
jgi:N-acetylmuramoyl-L-alanine amidase